MDEQAPPYLAIVPWDNERWFGSDAYHLLPTEAQGPYLNLCFRAFQRQPTCSIPDDDALLWRLANCGGIEEWRRLRGVVLGAGGWTLKDGVWVHPTVLETYIESFERHRRAVRAGRIAGKASARVRREVQKNQHVRTIVERPSNEPPTTVERSLSVRAARRAVKAGATAALDTPENRAPIDLYNEVFGTALKYRPGNLHAASRALAEGYTLEQIRVVLEAVRDRRTPSACWCADHNRELGYLLRPTYRSHKTGEQTESMLDKIANELDTGRRED